VNLERWADRPLVESAVEIWEAEFGASTEPAGRVARLEVASRGLAAMRAERSGRSMEFVDKVGEHARRLGHLGLRPGDLGADVSLRSGAAWTLRQLPWVAVPAAAVAAVGWALFWLPYRVTGRIALGMRPDDVERSTYKFLVGAVVYTCWVLLLAGLATAGANLAWGVAALLVLPAAGMGGLVIRERWRGAWRDARRFFLLRSRRPLLEGLRKRQRELAAGLRTLLDQGAEEISL
jgi:hypothetical protein